MNKSTLFWKSIYKLTNDKDEEENKVEANVKEKEKEKKEATEQTGEVQRKRRKYVAQLYSNEERTKSEDNTNLEW